MKPVFHAALLLMRYWKPYQMTQQSNSMIFGEWFNYVKQDWQPARSFKSGRHPLELKIIAHGVISILRLTPVIAFGILSFHWCWRISRQLIQEYHFLICYERGGGDEWGSMLWIWWIECVVQDSVAGNYSTIYLIRIHYDWFIVEPLEPCAVCGQIEC